MLLQFLNVTILSHFMICPCSSFLHHPDFLLVSCYSSNKMSFTSFREPPGIHNCGPTAPAEGTINKTLPLPPKHYISQPPLQAPNNTPSAAPGFFLFHLICGRHRYMLMVGDICHDNFLLGNSILSPIYWYITDLNK